MPAKGIFVLGVGHVRRKTLEPGARAESPAEITRVVAAELDDREWRVLLALKRELTLDEINESLWPARAREAGVSFADFCAVAKELEARRLIGRFSTFLEHVKPSETGVRVTRFNALFHWAVPAGREIEAGGEVGRHLILTHCYWREAGPEFGNVNIMAVAHGTEKRAPAGAQSRHRRSPARARHPGELHERLLGRPQRDQAFGDFPIRVPGLVGQDEASKNEVGAGSPSRPILSGKRPFEAKRLRRHMGRLGEPAPTFV